MPTPESDSDTIALTREAREATARIQDSGFLVVLGQDWRVRHVSANIAEHFADCGARMVGQPLADHFGAAAVHSLRNQLALMRDPHGTARLFSLIFAGVPKAFDVAMHFHEGAIILEALPAAHVEAGDPVGTVRQLAASLDGCETVADLVERGSHLLRALVGFDSVTMFRFDGDGPPERIAANARGLAATATECPEPITRVITDGGREGTPLDPEAPASLLERALLRSLAADESMPAEPSEAEASLCVPLSCAGEPWGVAVCLNRSPRRTTLDRIAAAELFGDLLAMRARLRELGG